MKLSQWYDKIIIVNLINLKSLRWYFPRTWKKKMYGKNTRGALKQIVGKNEIMWSMKVNKVRSCTREPWTFQFPTWSNFVQTKKRVGFKKKVREREREKKEKSREERKKKSWNDRYIARNVSTRIIQFNAFITLTRTVFFTSRIFVLFFFLSLSLFF